MQHSLLFCMLISYFVPIIIVYLKYDNNQSVSNILCDQKNQHIVLLFMLIMGGFSLLYEWNRQNILSFIFIALILIGIYGVICINETNLLHYGFALIIFASIFGFMIHHYFLSTNKILLGFLIAQFFLSLFMILFKTHFFLLEVMMIINFALYFLYLHFITNVI
jgi:hypothetical protein